MLLVVGMLPSRRSSSKPPCRPTALSSRRPLEWQIAEIKAGIAEVDDGQIGSERSSPNNGEATPVSNIQHYTYAAQKPPIGPLKQVSGSSELPRQPDRSVGNARHWLRPVDQ
jgi:hypothetical protein